MYFRWRQNIESTQISLANIIRENTQIQTPFVIAARNQTNGIGSRQNSWDKVDCGLYLSCALNKNLLPKDLPMQSSSIYFGMILLNIFKYFCNDLWLKWPNDFYLQDSKVGGLITQSIKDYIIFGIGLNIKSNKKHSLFNGNINKDLIDDKLQKSLYQSIDINNKEDFILYQIINKILDFLSFNIVKFDFYNNIDYEAKNVYCKSFLQDLTSWSSIFKKYKDEFCKSHKFYVNINENGIEYKISLHDSILQNDGSIKIGNKVLYSMR